MCRLRMHESVTLLNFHGPAGIDPSIDVSINCMNSDHSVIALLETGTLKSKTVHFQFVALHSDFYGYRKLRVINMLLPVTTDPGSQTCYPETCSTKLLTTKPFCT